VFLAGGLALSGCIDVECTPEFARPVSRERYCGHQGHVAMPTTYTQGYRAPAAQPVRVMTPPPADLPPGPPAAAPVGPPGHGPACAAARPDDDPLGLGPAVRHGFPRSRC